jgi:tetratricopeptide (TPR) repeat protein
MYSLSLRKPCIKTSRGLQNNSVSCAARFMPGGVILALLLLGGCAAPLQSTGLLSAPPTELAHGVELEQVPFFPQERYQCGPAALATVLTWSGAATKPEDLTAEVYLPQRRGSLAVELQAAARHHGRVSYVLEKEVQAVLREVQAGHPVVVLLNLGLSWYPRWHYAVVVGFDMQRDEIILRSGTVRRDVISLELFERTWRRGDSWAMVVMSPGDIPRTAKELPYLRAVMPFEQAGAWQAARDAYAAAWRQWPDSIGAGMGLGNSEYSRGDYVGAAAAFRRLLAQHPGFAPALNNLAQSLAESGELAAAEHYAEEALAVGGPQSDIYAETLQEIRGRIKR